MEITTKFNRGDEVWLLKPNTKTKVISGTVWQINVTAVGAPLDEVWETYYVMTEGDGGDRKGQVLASGDKLFASEEECRAHYGLKTKAK